MSYLKKKANYRGSGPKFANYYYLLQVFLKKSISKKFP